MRYIYWLTLIIGTTYLVGWFGWSKWTYIFMLILCNFPIRLKVNYKETEI